MRRLAESLLAALLPRRAEPIPIPIRRGDWRDGGLRGGPLRDGLRDGRRF